MTPPPRPAAWILRRVARPCIAGALLVGSLGCRTVPAGRAAVDDVTVRGANALDEDEILDKIGTTESPRFLGLFPGIVYEHSLFDRSVLQRDLARVEALYRAKGWYDAHARAGRVHWIDDKHVRVEIVVEEGRPVLVRDVRVDGLDSLPEAVAAAARAAAAGALRPGRPFEEGAFDRGRDAVRRALTDRGYAYADVRHDANVDVVARRADVFFTVDPGLECVFGPVTVEGLGGLPAAPVRRAVDIAPDEPFSESALESAQQAVLALGVFASVIVEPDLAEAPSRPCVVPVTVRVEPSRLRTIRIGGGIELDALKSDVHGSFGWESRSFLGGLRTFRIHLRPGLVLYPLRIHHIEAPSRLLPEERLRIELRQPGFLEPRTNAFVRPELNVQALLLDPTPPPSARVIGYAEARSGVGVDRTFRQLYVGLSHALQVAYPFAYVGSRDPTLDTLVISYPELVTQIDLRDDRVRPRRGGWIGNSLQVAGGPFGGHAEDVKVQPDVRGYVPLSRRVVLAVRASVGLLFPRNYGSNVRDPRGALQTPAERTRDYQLTFFRGFFSGGPTTNRGYPLRGVSPHALVPFISPELEAERLTTACAGEYDCRTPTGGFTLWEASIELRFDVDGPLSVATFCDASDVSPQPLDIRPTHPHLSCGGGARYDTPVGPIRLDVGWRVPGMQVLGGPTPDERIPQTFPFGIPIAVSLGIGEAY